MKLSEMPRGLRNNNPGNIRESKRVDYDWQGESVVDSDAEFEEFDTPAAGIRAIDRILTSYERRGVTTVGEVISTWAPATENDTAAYIAAVCRQCDCDPASLASNHRTSVILAIIHHELGMQPFTRSFVELCRSLD